MDIKIHICRNIIHPFPIFAWAIMIFQGMNPFKKSSWSHMAIEFDDKFFDATGKGVREHTRNEFLKQYDIKGTHKIKSLTTVVEFYSFFDEHRGKKYDVLQVFGLALKMLGLRKVNTSGEDFDKMICNELVIALLNHFYGFSFDDSDDYGLIDTWDEVVRHV